MYCKSEEKIVRLSEETDPKHVDLFSNLPYKKWLSCEQSSLFFQMLFWTQIIWGLIMSPLLSPASVISFIPLGSNTIRTLHCSSIALSQIIFWALDTFSCLLGISTYSTTIT